MSECEIRSRHKRAARPTEHVKILSELNACSVEEIKRILTLEDVPAAAKVEPAIAEEEKGMGSTERFRIDYDKVRELYEQGMSDAEIARRVGAAGASPIHRWRTNNNLPGHGVRQTARESKPAAAVTENTEHFTAEFMSDLGVLLKMFHGSGNTAVKDKVRELASALTVDEVCRMFSEITVGNGESKNEV